MWQFIKNVYLVISFFNAFGVIYACYEANKRVSFDRQFRGVKVVKPKHSFSSQLISLIWSFILIVFGCFCPILNILTLIGLVGDIDSIVERTAEKVISNNSQYEVPINKHTDDDWADK